MAKAFVEIIGDAESFVLSLRRSSASVATFKSELGTLNLSVAKSAEAQVKASALRVSRIREEIAAVQQLSSSYVKGSDEQIAAMSLVARKQAELARLQGVTASRYGVGGGGRFGGGGLRRDERQTSGLFRGGLRGAGIGGLGMSALAGGAFFGSYLGASALKTTVTAAVNARTIEKQLAAQYKASGQSLADYRGQIDKTLNRLSALAGFNKDELTQSFTAIFRAAGSTSAALKDESIAVNLARGRHMDLQTAALLVAKVINGNVGILRRYGIETWKGETATQALAAITQKYAGQAKAGTTAQQRFSAELHNSEVIIGTALLPTVNHLLTEGARWLDQMNRSGRLQRDVNTAVHDGTVLIHLLRSGVHLVTGAFRVADGVTGSFKNTLELLLAIKVASKLAGWAGDLGVMHTKTAAENDALLTMRGRLANLAAIGTIVITVDVLERLIPTKVTSKGQKILNQGGGGILGKIPIIGPVAQAGAYYGRQTRNAITGSGGQQQPVPKQYRDNMRERESYLSGLQDNAFPFGLNDPYFGTDYAAYVAGRKASGWPVGGKRPGSKTSGPGGGKTSPHKPSPITSFALPSNLQNQLAAALTPAQDRKAAQQALDYTQKLIDSGRLVGQAYTDALKERKKLYTEIARDAKKLAGRGARSGGSLLPASSQVALAKAQGDAASKSLPALQRLLKSEQDALATLRAQHDVGAARVKQVKEEAQLQEKIAATQRAIAAAEKTQEKAAAARRAEKILGIGQQTQTPSRIRLAMEERQILNTALAHAVFGSKASQNQIGYITKKTADLSLNQLVTLVKKDLGDKLPKATLDSLEKINEVLKLKLLPPDVLANIRARLAQIKQTLLAGLADIGQGYQAFKGVSSYQFVAGIPGLSRAQKVALEERYAQIQAHGGMATGTAAAGIVVPAAHKGGDIRIDQLTIHGVQNLDQLINEIEKRTRQKNQRRGNRR